MVTHAVGGKTVSRSVPAGPALEKTRSQIAEYQHFRELARALVAADEQICNARLEEWSAASSPEIKKNRAGRGLRRGSNARA
jgi:hypothetical protein